MSLGFWLFLMDGRVGFGGARGCDGLLSCLLNMLVRKGFVY